MEKEIEFSVDELMLAKINKPLRGAADIIDLLLETIKYILCHSPSENGKLKIIVGKMNRIFYVLESKIFSISMPFFTQARKDGSVIVYDHNGKLDSKYLAILSSVFNKFNDQLESAVGVLDFWQYLDEEDLDEEELDIISRLIIKLLLTEYGYVRYDDDEEHKKDKIHPRYHLDINCTNSCTYKLGLQKSIDFEWLKDCLNNNKPRKIIKF